MANLKKIVEKRSKIYISAIGVTTQKEKIVGKENVY
jgi:hypothetical protein